MGKYENTSALMEGLKAKIERVQKLKDFPAEKLKVLKEHLADTERVLAELKPAKELGI